jgi:DNA repair exonuclease SbcCD ATPase subunit
MLDKIRLIALGVALLASGWIGYGVGSSRNETARSQLRALEEAVRVAESRHLSAQQQLGEELKSREAANEARVRELQLAFDEQKAEMIDALDETQQRLDELASRRRVNDGELQTVRKALVVATGAHREALREREARLVQLQGQLKRLQTSLNCLSAPVPDEAVRTLNRVTTLRTAAAGGAK